LLHFEDGSHISSSKQCSERLSRHLTNYDKALDPRKITITMIEDAVRRAKTKDNPPCKDWPKRSGKTAYRLVQNILDSSKIA